jgi:hypothetical protein
MERGTATATADAAGVDVFMGTLTSSSESPDEESSFSKMDSILLPAF